MVASWEAALKLDKEGARVRYEAAKEVAKRRGVNYMPAPAVSALSLDELIRRVEAIPNNRDGIPNQRIGDAVLGGAPEPELTINDALEEYWKIAADRVRGKTPDQLRRWKHPRVRAFKNLVTVIGNKAVASITRADMKQFRDWWNGRIDKDGRSRHTLCFA